MIGTIRTKFYEIDDRHPYLVSLAISLVISAFVLFYTAPIYVADNLPPTDILQFVNIDTYSAPKKIVKRQISTKQGDVVDAGAERAMGTAEEASAVDISFFPNIAPPKPVGKLKKIYPQSARESNLEALLNVELLISSDGKVMRVSILGLRLSKELPPDAYARFAKDFSKAAVQILLGAQFSPPVINGKRVPIKMELPLKFRLEES